MNDQWPGEGRLGAGGTDGLASGGTIGTAREGAAVGNGKVLGTTEGGTGRSCPSEDSTWPRSDFTGLGRSACGSSAGDRAPPSEWTVAVMDDTSSPNPPGTELSPRELPTTTG